MLRLRTLSIGIVLAVHCGTTQPAPDGGTDSGGPDATSDSGKDSGKDGSGDAASDVVSSDVSSDAVTDAIADASADGSSDAGAGDGGWTVTSISGLVLWLDANTGVTTSGSSITKWADQSGQANDAIGDSDGGTPTPTLVASSINSLPAAHFVATSAQHLSIADATSLQWGTGDYFIAVVSKFDNDPTGGLSTGIGSFYAKLGTGSGALFFANDYNYAAALDGGTAFAAGLCSLEDPNTEVQYAASYNDGTARLYAVQRASGSEYLRVNGTQVASGTSTVDVTESGSVVNIGIISSGNAAALDGDIAEMIAVKGTLSSSDLSNIEAYLKSKYAL